MAVGIDAGHIDMGKVLHGFSEFRNETEHAYRSCESRGIGENITALGRNPVSSGGSVISIRSDNRLGLAQKLEFLADFVRSKYASTRRVHSEHHCLDHIVGPDIGNQLCKSVTSNILRIIISVHDFSVSIDYGNLVGAELRIGSAGDGIVLKGNERHVTEILCHIEVADFLFPLFPAHLSIRQAVCHKIFRFHKGKIVHKGIEGLRSDVSGSGNIIHEAVPY